MMWVCLCFPRHIHSSWSTVMALLCIPIPRLVYCTFSTIPICPFLVQRIFSFTCKSTDRQQFIVSGLHTLQVGGMSSLQHQQVCKCYSNSLLIHNTLNMPCTRANVFLHKQSKWFQSQMGNLHLLKLMNCLCHLHSIE